MKNPLFLSFLACGVPWHLTLHIHPLITLLYRGGLYPECASFVWHTLKSCTKCYVIYYKHLENIKAEIKKRETAMRYYKSTYSMYIRDLDIQVLKNS